MTVGLTAFMFGFWISVCAPWTVIAWREGLLDGPLDTLRFQLSCMFAPYIDLFRWIKGKKARHAS